VRFNYKCWRWKRHEARWPWPPETFGGQLQLPRALSHATRWAGDNDSCALCLLQVHLHSTVLRCKLPNAEVARTEKRKIDADARRGQWIKDISLLAKLCVCVCRGRTRIICCSAEWWFLIMSCARSPEAEIIALFCSPDLTPPLHILWNSRRRAAPRTDGSWYLFQCVNSN